MRKPRASPSLLQKIRIRNHHAGGKAATVAWYDVPGFHTWPPSHIPQDTAPKPLLRIRSTAKKTFGEAFGAATGVSDPRLQKIRIRNDYAEKLTSRRAHGIGNVVDGLTSPSDEGAKTLASWPSLNLTSPIGPSVHACRQNSSDTPKFCDACHFRFSSMVQVISFFGRHTSPHFFKPSVHLTSCSRFIPSILAEPDYSEAC